MIKKFEQYNEGINHLLVGPTEEEMWDGIKKMTPNNILIKSIENNLEYGVKYAIEHGANNLLYNSDIFNSIKKYLTDNEILNILIKKNNFYINILLVESCICGFFKGVEYSIDHGADINYGSLETGHTPIIKAVENNNYDIVKYLINKGAIFNMLDDYLLYSACRDGEYDIVKLLIDNGVNINSRDSWSNKSAIPLNAAIRNGHTKIVKLLNKYNIKSTNENLILEKSTLTVLGVPTNVMQSIQKDLSLSDDVKWEKIQTKKMVSEFFIKGGRNLFIQISINTIKVIVSYPSVKGTKYFVDKYRLVDGEWGGEFKKVNRQYKSYTQIMIEVRPNYNIYKLDGDFSINLQSTRKRIRKEIEFSEFHDIFTTEFLQRFDGILKRITGQGFKNAKGEIAEKAKQIAIENKMLIQSLDNPLKGNNGLSILDEFLLQFEDKYSEYFGEPITIQELVDMFSRDKVMTMLTYFIYKGKIMK